LYGTCAENIWLDLAKNCSEHEFDLLWTKLTHDERIFTKEDTILCADSDAVFLQSEYNITLYCLEDNLWD